ncbi:MAG TPA: hypothetical protein VIW70_17430 [Rubrivivax sp.]
MPDKPPANPFKTSRSFEFELTDFDEARKSLDEAPEGLAEAAAALEPDFWERRRRKSLPTDRALNGVAIEWVLALPIALRPMGLCDRYPRVANAIAEAWPIFELRRSMLDSLLEDKRGRRQGFPPEVRSEIETLRCVLPADIADFAPPAP